MNIRTLLMTMIVCAFTFAGCDNNDGPAERAGESLDDAATDLGNAVEDACEDVKEGVDADDTDC